jgi:hypothetical protein
MNFDQPAGTADQSAGRLGTQIDILIYWQQILHEFSNKFSTPAGWTAVQIPHSLMKFNVLPLNQKPSMHNVLRCKR